MESTKVDRPAQHAHVLLAIGSIQGSHRFVPEQRFVTNAFTLPHVVNGNAQVDGFIARIGYARTASATSHSRH